MIRGEDNERAGAQSVFIQRGENLCQQLVLLPERPHLYAAHPTPVVSLQIACGEMDEHQPKALFDLCNCQVADGEVGFLEDKHIRARGFSDLPQFFLAHDHHRPQASRVRDIEQIRAERVSVFGHVIIPVHGMFGRTHPRQHRGV